MAVAVWPDVLLLQEQATRHGLSAEQEHRAVAEQLESLELKAKQRRSAAFTVWGNDFHLNHPYISPLAGGLAVWGLTIDDVEVHASC